MHVIIVCYVPLSICSTTFRLDQRSHALQFFSTRRGIGILLTTSGSMTSDERNPPEACHAMWQWNAQMPVFNLY